MRILVTNDDGVHAPGLVALAAALRTDGHDLLVVAPSRDRSGASAAIGPLHRLDAIPVTEHEWPELPGVRVCSIDAPPATAVYVACLGGFGFTPDLVASGVNPGANTGHLVLHSGTVGAALTAAGLGVPGLAVSVVSGDVCHFDTAATLAAAAVEWVGAPGGSRPASAAPRVLSLNVPNVALADLAGVRAARLAAYGEVWVASADEPGGDLRVEYRGQGVEPEPDTDRALLRAGFVTVTSLVSIDGVAVNGAADAITAALARS